MIGSIIQAVKGHFKDTASIADKWTKESMKDKESKDIEKSVDEAQKKVESSATENQDTLNTAQEPSETETSEQTTEQATETTETVPEKKGSTSMGFSILSDEESKDITAGDDGKDITGQSTSSGADSKGGTAGMVLNIVNSVRKDLQNVGKTISSKGKSGSSIFGENTYKAVAPIVKAKYSSNVSNTSAPASSNVPSDACLKQFFYDDDDNSFHDSDILDAYKNLQAIEFTYKPEATEIDPTQDTETVHVGLKAQDIEAQPELASAIKEDPESGYKMVDTREMTMQNAAAISEIAKMLEEIQQKLNSLT